MLLNERQFANAARGGDPGASDAGGGATALGHRQLLQETPNSSNSAPFLTCRSFDVPVRDEDFSEKNIFFHTAHGDCFLVII